MGVTKIEWCDFTFNPWGSNGTRVVASEAMWREPVKWDKAACPQADRPRVFCASLADVFEQWDGPMMSASGEKLWKAWHTNTIIATEERPKPNFSPLTMQDVRARLFRLIDATPNLSWLLLTKRPENIARMMPPYTPEGPRSNVWLGVSVEDQATADERIPHLLRVPATIRFLSVEPMLGPVDLMLLGGQRIHGVDWVIVGGESGHGARRFELDWARSIQSQCDKANVPWFFKQAGSNPHDWDTGDPPNYIPPEIVPLRLIDRKGGDMREFPNNLQVREFPPPA